jgi:murein DD-endopeptidase MepM/ murein hydrolase activator NlpD
MKRVSDEFDPNSRGGRGHFGMDISGTEGSPINSVGAGKVIRANSAGGYGNRIEIEHPNGLVSSYSHLSKFRVKVGDEVRAGQVIGLMGSTGRSSGPHLHLEFQRGAGGKRVDPRLALQSFVQKPKVRRSIQPVILKQPAQQSSQNTRSAPASGVQPTKKTGGPTSTSLRKFYELAEKF